MKTPFQPFQIHTHWYCYYYNKIFPIINLVTVLQVLNNDVKLLYGNRNYNKSFVRVHPLHPHGCSQLRPN